MVDFWALLALLAKEQLERKLKEYFEEKQISGTIERPKIDVLVVASLDRLSRNPTQATAMMN